MVVEQIEIPNIDNPHPDAMSVHSTGSYGNEDASDTSSNPKKKAPRRRSSLVDPNERHVCKFCEQEMGSRKEKIKHQVSRLRLNCELSNICFPLYGVFTLDVSGTGKGTWT